MSDETTTAVQTEGTSLAMVMETTLGSRTPPATGWFTLDPNSYGEFGASFKKLPRSIISKSLQAQKGMLVDEDSGISFEVDITKDNIDRIGESLYRSVTKHGGNTGQSQWRPSSVTSTKYVVDADGDLTERHLVVGRGFNVEGNNGLHLVGAGSTDTELKASGLATESAPPANACVDLAGWRGATGDLFLDTSGMLNSTVANFTTMGLNDFQWVYIGGAADANKFDTVEYFGACRIAVNGIAAHKLTFDMWSWDVEAFASLDFSSVAAQLDTVVQAKASGTAGNAITVASVADGDIAVKAELDMNSGGNSVHIDTIVRAKVGGVDGNAITVEVTSGAPTAAGVKTEVGSHVKLQIKVTSVATTVADIETLIATCTLIEVKTPGTGATILDATDVFDSAPLAGGLDADAPTYAEVSSAITIHYTPNVTTVAEIEALIAAESTLIEVKTAGTPDAVLQTGDDDFGATNLTGGGDGDDAGTGKNIDLYFTRWWRNVTMDHADFRRPSSAFEVVYPELYDGQPGYEYILGNMLDEATFNFPVTSKATLNLSYKGTRTLPITDTRKTGPADAIDPVTKLGVSTATDLQRLRVEDLDGNGVSSDLTSAKLMVKNNIGPEKQLGKLGARIMNQGEHTQMFEADVIFTDSVVINAVRDNRTCTYDTLMRNGDFGAMVDVQAMTLDMANKKLEKNKSIKVSSKGTGFEHAKSGSTGSLSMFGYLPELPAEE